MKLNCWEFKKCGKEPGSANKGRNGTCPAVAEQRLDGVHGGKNAGRACWAIAGTMCKGDVQGDFARKFRDCHDCDFFKAVVKEEGADFKFSVKLHEMLSRQTDEAPVCRTSK